MYDWPEMRWATDEFWAGLAHHAKLVGGLDRGGSHDALWRDPTLDFSQTCGYPLTHEFKGLLNYVATPHYSADGCAGAGYSSFIFARHAGDLGDMKGARPAINAMDSMSGFLALKLVFAPHDEAGDLFAPPLLTGSHLASLAAVQNGKADVCAIDCVCVALARKYRPEALRGLVEIARSPQVPGLPYVTRTGDIAKLRTALRHAFDDPTLKAAREALLLADVSVLPTDAYDVIPQLEAGL